MLTPKEQDIIRRWNDFYLKPVRGTVQDQRKRLVDYFQEFNTNQPEVGAYHEAVQLKAGLSADIAVPRATYTGWNVTIPDYRDLKYLSGLVGGFEPFTRTREERTASGDGRLSISERYTGRADYLAKVQQAADGLVQRRFLRREDVPAVLQRADQVWSVVMSAGAR